MQLPESEVFRTRSDHRFSEIDRRIKGRYLLRFMIATGRFTWFLARCQAEKSLSQHNFGSVLPLDIKLGGSSPSDIRQSQSGGSRRRHSDFYGLALKASLPP